jgi:hypothetical protein
LDNTRLTQDLVVELTTTAEPNQVEEYELQLSLGLGFVELKNAN